MPLQDDMHLISVDDHVVEPPHVWQDRLPAAMREAGPRIVDGPAPEGQPPSRERDDPHSDSQFPGSRTRAAEVFADIPDDDVRRIVETNARTIFRFPR